MFVSAIKGLIGFFCLETIKRERAKCPPLVDFKVVRFAKVSRKQVLFSFESIKIKVP